MNNPQINKLASLWAIYKQEESEAIANRREIEDQLSELLDINSAAESTTVHETQDYAIKVQTRMTRKVNTDKLQEIAAEHDLNNEVSQLFRWKAEVDLKAWKSAAPEVSQVLAQALTTTAGRPSYSITKENE